MPYSSVLAAVYIAILWLIALPNASCLQIGMTFGSRKCFTEQIPRGAKVYADFHSSSLATPLEIDVFITNERGVVVAHKSALTAHKFTIDGSPSNAQGGPRWETYRICLLHQPHPHQVAIEGLTLISFKIRAGGAGVEEKGLQILESKHVDFVKDKIRLVEEDLNLVLGRMDDIRVQEEALFRHNRATATQLVSLSSVTSIVIVLIGFLQFDAVKSALRKRKFIP